MEKAMEGDVEFFKQFLLLIITKSPLNKE